MFKEETANTCPSCDSELDEDKVCTSRNCPEGHNPHEDPDFYPY